jgi:hypothetical protein
VEPEGSVTFVGSPPTVDKKRILEGLADMTTDPELGELAVALIEAIALPLTDERLGRVRKAAEAVVGDDEN